MTMAAGSRSISSQGRGFLARLRRFFARMSPDSLFARLILIFSGGFFAMLLLTTIYAGESRHFYFMRGLMADRARRMAEVAALLDATSAEIRFVLREQFNSRGFFVSFTSSWMRTCGKLPCSWNTCSTFPFPVCTATAGRITAG